MTKKFVCLAPRKGEEKEVFRIEQGNSDAPFRKRWLQFTPHQSLIDCIWQQLSVGEFKRGSWRYHKTLPDVAIWELLTPAGQNTVFVEFDDGINAGENQKLVHLLLSVEPGDTEEFRQFVKLLTQLMKDFGLQAFIAVEGAWVLLSDLNEIQA